MTQTTIARSLNKSRSATFNDGKSKLKAGVSKDSAEMRSLQLREAVRELREPKATEPEKQTTPRLNASDGPINILIVDDESKNLTVLETVLSNPVAYRLIKAESAEQALLALLADEFARWLAISTSHPPR